MTTPPIAPVLNASGAAEVWPFTCTPGQLADRLDEAYRFFGAMLPAVRCVFIEGGKVGIAAQSEPKGVPREATDAMAESVKNIVSAYAAKKIWRQMLDAAPPATPDKVSGEPTQATVDAGTCVGPADRERPCGLCGSPPGEKCRLTPAGTRPCLMCGKPWAATPAPAAGSPADKERDAFWGAADKPPTPDDGRSDAEFLLRTSIALLRDALLLLDTRTALWQRIADFIVDNKL